MIYWKYIENKLRADSNKPQKLQYGGMNLNFLTYREKCTLYSILQMNLVLSIRWECTFKSKRSWNRKRSTVKSQERGGRKKEEKNVPAEVNKERSLRGKWAPQRREITSSFGRLRRLRLNKWVFEVYCVTFLPIYVPYKLREIWFLSSIDEMNKLCPLRTVIWRFEKSIGTNFVITSELGCQVVLGIQPLRSPCLKM